MGRATGSVASGTETTVFATATVVDGSGGPAMTADVLVRGDRIVDVAPPGTTLADRTIDARGLVLAPGFIDVHVHLDARILVDPVYEAGLRQGVTTVILGQDGCGYAPASPDTMAFMRTMSAGFNGNPDIDWSWRSVAEYLDRVGRVTFVNVAYLVPFGCLRAEVMGLSSRPATSRDIRRMRDLASEARDHGAIGMSWGYHYAPNTYASVNELAGAMAAFGGHGTFAAHMRNYEREQRASLLECADVGRRTGSRVHIAHLNMRYHEGIPTIEEVNASGVRMTYDTYPYLAGATVLVRTLPEWATEGTKDQIVARLADPAARARLRPWLESTGRRWESKRLSWIGSAAYRHYTDLSPAEAAQRAGLPVTDFVCDLLMASDLEVGMIGFRYHRQDETDVEGLMQHEAHVFGSDGVYVGDNPHPRGYGTFARILSTYVRDRHVLGLEEAIRHMTSAPAEAFGLGLRGRIAPGWAADLVLFDPAKITDTATYEVGADLATGVHSVMIGGVLAIDDGRLGQRPAARILREGSLQVPTARRPPVTT